MAKLDEVQRSAAHDARVSTSNRRAEWHERRLNIEATLEGTMRELEETGHQQQILAAIRERLEGEVSVLREVARMMSEVDDPDAVPDDYNMPSAPRRA